MDISKAISAIRESKGIKQVDIATTLGIEQSNYSRLEKRGNKLAVDQLQAIAKVLGVTLLDILTWGEAKPISDNTEIVKEAQQLRKRVEELESMINDKNLIINAIKVLINSRLNSIFDQIIAEHNLGFVQYENDKGLITKTSYYTLSPQDIPDSYEFGLSDEEQEQVYKYMFTRIEYSVEATFLISTGFVEDQQTLEAFRKYAPEQPLNRNAINPFQLGRLKKSNNPSYNPLKEVGREIFQKEVADTNE